MTEPRASNLAVLAPVVLALLLLPSAASAQGERGRQLPSPDHPNVSYGEHERQVFDLWLPAVDEPAPLVLYIHGGGFRGGDKRSLSPGALRACLSAGWAVAAINYRLTDTAPAPAAYRDCARALQHLRHHAERWNLDGSRVASTGGSAGAGTSMWLAFHDDLADPDSDDPIARESTRLTCIAVTNGQSSYDPRFAERIGIPRPNFERHPFFLPFYGIEEDEIDTPEAHRRYERAAPITYLSADDPPALLMYTYPNEPVDDDTPLSLIVHHPLFGLALKEEMDALGIECIVQYADPETGDRVQEPPAQQQGRIGPRQFIARHFEAAADD